jgi:DNA modification methylase
MTSGGSRQGDKGWLLQGIGSEAFMPTLDWIGKKAVLNHHREVPYRLLRCDARLSVGDPGSGNLLVQGDNLVALKALLPYYAGQVKCIYIDPPYNTGNENWVYNDAVNSPEMRDWLGQVVGREAEDLSRHDKWLCMMYPRLVLLRDFLSQDGVLLVSLDDTELGHLRVILDEIFGKANFIGSFVWNTRNTDNRVKTLLSPDHEYIIAYGRSRGVSILGRRIDRDYKNPDNDPRGPYVTDPLTGKATAAERPNLHAYNMEQPGTTNVWKPDPAKGWITDEAGYKELLRGNRIWWPPNPATGKPRKKRFLSETRERMPASSFWPEFRAQSGAKEVGDIIGERVFAFPKPMSVIQKVIDHCAPPDCIVLDSFAGTGTTAHAVLAQNKTDGGNRRFILVEMEDAICQNVTAERIRKAVEGYDNSPALGGGFRFCTLGEPLFDGDGQLCKAVRFDDLAHHVFFSETGEPLPQRANGRSPLIGVCKDTAYYLLYNGILGDKSPAGGNVLTGAVLGRLPTNPAGRDRPRIVLGEGCRLSAERLKRERITFKQIPYEIKVT